MRPARCRCQQEAAVVVTYLNDAAAPPRAPVVAAHPGLFPAVFHQDGTRNAASNPAAAGSVVVLYSTGQGAGDISLRIGGQAAELLNAGPAPGTLGVWQFNARLPEGVSGEAAVALSAQGAQSQSSLV